MHTRHAVRLGVALLALGATLGVPERARAAYHLWEIAEVYSNQDGSVQYVELSTSWHVQGALQGHDVVFTSTTGAVDTVITFTFPASVSSNTQNRALLLATPGFVNLPGAVTPDFVLPCGPLFDPNADSITIDFAGADSVMFAGTDLPGNGDDALDGTGRVVAASPENFAGEVGAPMLKACQVSGSCDACDDGLFCNGPETCGWNGTCESGPAPCPQAMCDEAMGWCEGRDGSAGAGAEDAGSGDSGSADMDGPAKDDAGTTDGAAPSDDAAPNDDAGTVTNDGAPTDAGGRSGAGGPDSGPMMGDAGTMPTPGNGSGCAVPSGKPSPHPALLLGAAVLLAVRRLRG